MKEMTAQRTVDIIWGHVEEVGEEKATVECIRSLSNLISSLCSQSPTLPSDMARASIALSTLELIHGEPVAEEITALELMEAGDTYRGKREA